MAMKYSSQCDRADVVVVGAGISGLTFSRAYAEKNPGKRILVVERREELGGNCHDRVNEEGLLVQKYGPHIFHTNSDKVWEFLSRFTKWSDYKHKVIARFGGDYYPVPINRNTINKFFKINLKAENEVKAYLDGLKVPQKEIKNSRDVVISRFGVELYEAFIRHYTKKQWGVYPEELPASVLERLPVRYDDNDYYYNAKYQGMPVEGFTRMFERMVDLPNIRLNLGQDFRAVKDDFDDETMIIYTGRVDELFDFSKGRLPYLYTGFVFETLGTESYQPNSVVNHPEEETKHIRSTEFKKLTMQRHAKTTICKEFMRPDGVPTHPVPGDGSKILHAEYSGSAPKNMHFLGRLGRHRYLDIDAACAEALNLAEELS
jgi:UDP-galactopyranose mutase